MQPQHRTRTVRVGALAVAGILVLAASGPLGAQRGVSVPVEADVETITHVLNRLGFGPAPGDIERVRTMGLSAYIEEQLHPERLADTALTARLQAMPTLTMTSRELAEQFFIPADELNRQQQAAARQAAANPTMTPPDQPQRPQMTPEEREIRQAAQRVTAELMQAKMLRAVLSERQLEEVLVDFWFNHFNVFVGKGQVRQYVTEYEREAVRPYVLGRFRDMLGATAHHPAMLFYLDNFQSQAPPDAETLAAAGRRGRGGRAGRPPQMRPGQPQRPARGLNENYARELMELHTLGVDGGYTQQDVVEVARILTGWTIDQPRGERG